MFYIILPRNGTLRPDSKDSRFPINRMPMGLVEYVPQFFAFDNLQQVKREVCTCQFNILVSLGRFLVPWTIVFGHRLCTVTLEKNGSSYIVGQCGALLIQRSILKVLLVQQDTSKRL